MAIFKRFSQLVKSNIESLLSKAQNPEKEIELLFYEMEQELNQAKNLLRDQMVQEKLLKKQVDEAFYQVSKWQEYARNALLKQDEELAREALTHQLAAEGKLTRVEQDYAEQARAVTQLTAQLQENTRKLQTLKMKKETLKAQVRAGSLSLENAESVQRFNDIEMGIENNETQVEGMTEAEKVLASDTTSLSNQELLMPASDVEARLAALKAKLG